MSQSEHTNEIGGEQPIELMGLLGRCLGNYKMVERVLATFRSTGRSDLERLERAINAEDFQTAADISHRFRGAASNVSATRLREVLKRSEQLSKEENRDELLMILGTLQLEWDEFERQSQSLAPLTGKGYAGQVRESQSFRETTHAGTNC
jgi:HPt (histidine-containing phosphotransfer) domain-containing protein